ncbi:MAG: hypothetical protein IPO32_07155 [Crocinitomicaceae bacterium]|nr:hypothetical protein [Crocinitomicaceae bacterium]
MGERDTVDLVLIGLYITGAVLLLITAYLIYLRRYIKRGKMKMLNDVILHTSRYDLYHAPTKFLLELPKKSQVDLALLDENEKLVLQLLNIEMEAGQHPVAFDPTPLSDGVYYLSLKTDNASFLRRITIEKK